MRNTLAFVLRKIGGTYDACLAGAGRPAGFVSPGAPALGSVVGVFAAVVMPLLLLLGAATALLAVAAHAPLHLALHVAHAGHAGSAALAGLAIGHTVPMETKQLLDEMKSTFEQFKQADTSRGTEVKRLGEATGETTQQVKALNTRLDEIEIKMQRARVNGGLARIDDEMRAEREQRGPERKAFAKWARRGAARLDADEVKSLTSLQHLDPETAEFKALETDSNVEGGVFVPPQLADRVIQKLILVSPFRSVAAVEAISSNALEIPAEGTTNFSAGWVGERTTRPNTNTASLRMERIPVHEMYAEPPVSQTQLDDSVFDIESWLTQRVATTMAQIEGQAFISGTGVGQPEGVMVSASVTQQVTNAATVTADKLLTMWATLPTFYANAATWVLNRLTLGAIRQLKDNNNQYIWQPGGFGGPALAAGFPATILGQPYVEMPDMQNIGSGNYPIALGNFRAGYQIADRLGMRVIRDNLTQKPFVLFYTTKRVGGQVVLGEAIIKFKTT